ncbi:hypothetical protein [Lentzea sp. NBRC 102530]|uniref:hypothetical protein n=1 Tax=Lentzea sp. NBRC 102530 TaxID=3032201 RepID=UPI0024A2C045|nr:hypothetical protein [Lentzea sp. NBRC 102530]GLY52153.1 hypothetical protein Lesp01_58090 [Lentzea sp. NBRC 102530]
MGLPGPRRTDRARPRRAGRRQAQRPARPGRGPELTALLDFEWARFGDPLDDWFFLARFSGPHLHAVLGLIAAETGVPLDELRVECEVREASHLVADLPFGRRRVLEMLVAGLWHPQ